MEHRLLVDLADGRIQMYRGFYLYDVKGLTRETVAKVVETVSGYPGTTDLQRVKVREWGDAYKHVELLAGPTNA